MVIIQIMMREEIKMKRLLSIFLTALLICGGILGCTHVHTEECGENGIDCRHQCNDIVPFNDENKPF